MKKGQHKSTGDDFYLPPRKDDKEPNPVVVAVFVVAIALLCLGVAFVFVGGGIWTLVYIVGSAWRAATGG